MNLSLPSLLNVGALTLLVLFIYSTLGVFLFSSVKKGTNITNYTNFWNFHGALITLFRCTTGENWQYIMNDLSNTSASCTPNVTCGSCIYNILFKKRIFHNIFFNIYYVDDNNYAKSIYTHNFE